MKTTKTKKQFILDEKIKNNIQRNYNSVKESVTSLELETGLKFPELMSK